MLKKFLLGIGIAALSPAIHADEVIESNLPMKNPPPLHIGVEPPHVFKPLAVTLSEAESFMFQSTDSPLVFAGKGNKIEVTFLTFPNSDIAPDKTEIFDEPPVTVLNATEETLCRIDGGNWTRGRNFLSDDERYLLLTEFSGAYEALVSYDTRTCQEIKRFTLSDKRWRLDNYSVLNFESCSDELLADCAPAQTLDLREFRGD